MFPGLDVAIFTMFKYSYFASFEKSNSPNVNSKSYVFVCYLFSMLVYVSREGGLDTPEARVPAGAVALPLGGEVRDDRIGCGVGSQG